MAERFGEAQDLFPQIRSKKSLLDLSLLDFVLVNADTSVRLVNTLRSATSDDVVPFATLRDYINADETASARMLAVPGLGRTSLAELDGLVSRFTASREAREASPYMELAGVDISEAFEVSMFDFLQSQSRVSTRLFNAIRGAELEGECPFANVGEYLAS